jgi:hypothetical protein
MSGSNDLRDTLVDLTAQYGLAGVILELAHIAEACAAMTSGLLREPMESRCGAPGFCAPLWPTGAAATSGLIVAKIRWPAR